MITFKEFITEHVLNIGLNPDHDKHREHHRAEIHDMLRRSYSTVDGGYSGMGSGSEAESKAIHDDISNSLIKATKRGDHISSVALYKQSHGRKSIAGATDGTDQGKKDYLKAKLEDHEQKRAWGEVSGKVEHLSNKLGIPKISTDHGSKLLNKQITPHEDGYHYDRKIGDRVHTKVIVGHPKLDK